MSYMKPGLPWLYDDATGDIMGVKDSDGSETLFPIYIFPSGNNDSINIQAAIDAAYAAGGGIVRLGPYFYKVKNLTPKSGVKIIAPPSPWSIPSNCPDLSIDLTAGCRLVGDGQTITSITPGNPTIITSNAYPWTTGASVTIGGIQGTIGLPINGKAFSITQVTANTFSIPIDTTGKVYGQGGFAATSYGFTFNTVNQTGGIDNTTPVANFQLENIGFKNHVSAIRAGALDSKSFGFGGMENVIAINCSGIAFDIWNAQHFNTKNVVGFNVTALARLRAWHTTCQPGNSSWYDPYAYLWFASNPLYGIKVEALYSGTPGAGQLHNYEVFHRPQINAYGGTNNAYSAAAVAITAVTPGATTVITAAGLNAQLGDVITMSGFGGGSNVLVNGNSYTCIGVSGNNYTLDIDTTGYSLTTGSSVAWTPNANIILAGDRTHGAQVNSCSMYDADTEGEMEQNIILCSNSNTYITHKGPSTATDVQNAVGVFNSQYTTLHSTSVNETVRCDTLSDPSFLLGTIGWFNGIGRLRGFYYALKTENGAATDGYTHLGAFSGDSFDVHINPSNNMIETQLIPIAGQFIQQAANRTWGRYDFGQQPVVQVTASSTTQTLPDPATAYNFQITFKNAAGVTGTTLATAAGTIDGSATQSLAAAYNYITVMSDKTTWNVIAKG